MVINFRAHGISWETRKLAQTPTLNLKKYIYITTLVLQDHPIFGTSVTKQFQTKILYWHVPIVRNQKFFYFFNLKIINSSISLALRHLAPPPISLLLLLLFSYGIFMDDKDCHIRAFLSALIFYNSCRGPTGLDGCLGFLDLFHQFPSHIHTFKALDSHGYSTM